ncbi:hypothetical protein V8E53_003091 [Lactarius tabidus]
MHTTRKKVQRVLVAFGKKNMNCTSYLASHSKGADSETISRMFAGLLLKRRVRDNPYMGVQLKESWGCWFGVMVNTTGETRKCKDFSDLPITSSQLITLIYGTLCNRGTQLSYFSHTIVTEHMITVANFPQAVKISKRKHFKSYSSSECILSVSE